MATLPHHRSPPASVTPTPSMRPPPPANLYDRRHQQLLSAGNNPLAAALAVVDAYLDGKPAQRGKHRLGWGERDAAFWSSAVVRTLAPADWKREGPMLALVRYFRQTRIEALAVLAPIAAATPETLVLAVRLGDLVRRPDSPRRQDLARLAEDSAALAELQRILETLDRAERERRHEVERWTQALAGLSPLELLAYASLHAFEHLVPRHPGADAAAAGVRRLDFWEAINDILAARLATAAPGQLEPTQAEVAASIGKHLSPFLFPSPEGPPQRHDLREAFARLVAAQTELNAYLTQSAEAFSYDPGVRFVRDGARLDLVVVDDSLREARQCENDKLGRLHCYWFYRALDAFVAAGMAQLRIGDADNHEANQLACIRASQACLRLTEVYGVSPGISTDSGERVDLYQALLALELMSGFFRQEFLAVFARNVQLSGHWLPALAALALNGLADGNQIRFPLTWSDRSEKIERITAWTLSPELPQGSRRDAAAILDFWTSDWGAMAERLRRGGQGIQPALFERPVLKLGEILVQLPWVVGLQNNSAAAINNLRRLGTRRDEAGAETRRIEQQLGEHFRQRGFRVLHGWQPPGDVGQDAGEIDLLCAADDVILVLELKSTYLRQSIRDTWVHATTTLRKAGQQLRRKVAAVRQALGQDSELRQHLGLGANPDGATVLGWIVDTSIECDHLHFGGFLKVSLEEVLIALRDDSGYLDDPSGCFAGRPGGIAAFEPAAALRGPTLYPDGFSAARFVAVIDSEAVWQPHPRLAN